MNFKKFISNKVLFMISSFLIFGAVSVIASGIFVSEEGIQANYMSEDGNLGLTFNMSFKELVNNNYELVVENGIIVNVTNSSSDNETIQSIEAISNHATLSNQLISYYDLDEISGTTVNDLIGSNNGASNGISLNQIGQLGTSYGFDGSSGYVDLGIMNNFGDNLDVNPTTISLWIKSDGTTSGTMIGQHDGGDMFVLYSNMNPSDWSYLKGAVAFSIRDSSMNSIWGGLAYDSGYSDSQWHHLVVSVDPNSKEMSFWVDNIKQTTTMISQQTIVKPNFISSLKMGQRNNGFYFSGKLDEVGIWSRALTPIEVSDLYNNGSGLAYD